MDTIVPDGNIIATIWIKFQSKILDEGGCADYNRKRNGKLRTHDEFSGSDLNEN